MKFPQIRRKLQLFSNAGIQLIASAAENAETSAGNAQTMTQVA